MTESNPEEQAEPLVSTHRVRMNFGTYKGKLVTRLPVSYLKWMVTNSIAVKLTLLDGTEMDAYVVAGSEIVRRGMRLATSDVSPHAIDRLSQNTSAGGGKAELRMKVCIPGRNA